jgi:hypothetical protein
MARREWLASDERYGGKVFDWISSEPMKPDTLSWNGRGQTLSDVSGSACGAMGHELGHAFGLSHDMAGDSNRKGNLMGNGCRGMRGYFAPELTSDRCVLGAPSAAVLDKSGCFAVRRLRPKSSAFFGKTTGQQ